MVALDDRKAAVLRALVHTFVRTGEPVASGRLVEEAGLGVSSATLRSELAALEAAGLIEQPHTSAGRVPTDSGYRWYVDSLSAELMTTDPALQPEQQAALQQLLAEARDLEDLLRRTATALSRVTRYAALVVAPAIDRSQLKHLELVQLGPSVVLAVLITDTGRIDKHTLVLDEPVSDLDLSRARYGINETAVGLRVAQAPDLIAGVAEGAPSELRGVLDALSGQLRDSFARAARDPDRVYVTGAANIAGHGWLENLSQVQRVVEAVSDQVVALRALRETLQTGDPAVRIGTELSLADLAACSVVAARYGSGSARGSVGVVGPTRMDYPQTVRAVQAVASVVEQAVGELTGGR